MFKLHPTTSHVERTVNKKNEEEKEKDDVESRVQLLTASRFFLLIPKSALRHQFEVQKYRKYRKFTSVSLLLLAAIVFVQTLITLIVRNFLDITAAFIAVRSVFSGYIAVLVLFGKFFEKREWLERILLFIGLLYGTFVLIYQSYRSNLDAEWFHSVDFLELIILLVMGLSCRLF